MRFEKLMNSKIYRVFEMIFNLIILNLITLLLFIVGLGIFSIMPALVALIIVLRSLKSETTLPVVKVYFRAFKANYFRVFKLSLFYLFLGIVFVFNTYFFYSAFIDWQGVINEVIYYVWIIIDLIYIAAFINACFICVYFPNLDNKKIIKYSFKLLKAIPVKVLFIIFMLILFVITTFLVPLIGIFISVSLFFYLANFLIENTYLRIVADGVKSIDAQDYLYVNGEIEDEK